MSNASRVQPYFSHSYSAWSIGLGYGGGQVKRFDNELDAWREFGKSVMNQGIRVQHPIE